MLRKVETARGRPVLTGERLALYLATRTLLFCFCPICFKTLNLRHHSSWFARQNGIVDDDRK